MTPVPPWVRNAAAFGPTRYETPLSVTGQPAELLRLNESDARDASCAMTGAAAGTTARLAVIAATIVNRVTRSRRVG
jgi:hypothetical protein